MYQESGEDLLEVLPIHVFQNPSVQMGSTVIIKNVSKDADNFHIVLRDIIHHDI